MSARAGDPPLRSRRHPLILRIRRLVARPAVARREGVFLAEGLHLCEEALAADLTPEVLFCAPRLERDPAAARFLARARAADWPLQPIADALWPAVSAIETPPGFLGLFPRPASGGLQALSRAATGAHRHASALRLLGLDRVQDPVNLGVLARSAWAFGCRGLVTLRETVDPYHPRALRASSGMLLRLALATDVPATSLADWCAAERMRVLRLTPHGGTPLRSVRADGRGLLLLVGSEGQGFSPQGLALEAEGVTIEMRAEAESLGVAAAGTIALYVLAPRT
ncbi:MAG: hypothetical protein GF330_09545 [Candidatus Eisenbacteria bacterium]|nr:hypothetical protein [Candidatus Eisenbacteria bacterium]